MSFRSIPQAGVWHGVIQEVRHGIWNMEGQQRNTSHIPSWGSPSAIRAAMLVEVDEDMVPVGYGFELEAATGTIDLHHLADIAARIAEGAGE